VHEVKRPALVRPRDHRQQRAGANSAAPRLASARSQPFLGLETLRLLAAHPHAFPQQQRMQAPVAKASTLTGQLTQPPAQRGVVAPLGRYRMLVRSAPTMPHARRSLTPRLARRCATAPRPAAGGVAEGSNDAKRRWHGYAGAASFFQAGPSAPRCRACSRPAAASARRSRRNAKRLRLTSSSPRSRLASDSSRPPCRDFQA